MPSKSQQIRVLPPRIVRYALTNSLVATLCALDLLTWLTILRYRRSCKQSQDKRKN